MQFLNFQLQHQVSRQRAAMPSVGGTSVRRAQGVSGCPQTSRILRAQWCWRRQWLLVMLAARCRPQAHNRRRPHSCFVRSTSRRCGARLCWQRQRWLQRHAHMHTTLDAFPYGLSCTAPAPATRWIVLSHKNGPKVWSSIGAKVSHWWTQQSGLRCHLESKWVKSRGSFVANWICSCVFLTWDFHYLCSDKSTAIITAAWPGRVRNDLISFTTVIPQVSELERLLYYILLPWNIHMYICILLWHYI